MIADRMYNFFYRHPVIILFILIMIEGFIIAFYLVMFPFTLSRSTASEILRILIEFDGVLIGFSAIIGALIVERPGRGASSGITRHIASSLGFTLIFFIFSVLTSIYYIAVLDVRGSLDSIALGYPLYFMVAAITILFVMIALAFPPKKI